MPWLQQMPHRRRSDLRFWNHTRLKDAGRGVGGKEDIIRPIRDLPTSNPPADTLLTGIHTLLPRHWEAEAP